MSGTSNPNYMTNAELLELEVNAAITRRLLIESGGSSSPPPTSPPPIPPDPLPGSIEDQAWQQLANPVYVYSKLDPTLNGNYLIDSFSRQHMTSINSAISNGLGLPSGANTFNWSDADNNPHEWTAPQFAAFSQAVYTYWYTLRQTAEGLSQYLPQPLLIIP